MSYFNHKTDPNLIKRTLFLCSFTKAWQNLGMLSGNMHRAIRLVVDAGMDPGKSYRILSEA